MSIITYSRSELREIILAEQGRVGQELIVRSARRFLNRALWDFRKKCPQFHRVLLLEGDTYYGCVNQMCSKIVYHYSAQWILNSPICLPRLPQYAKEGLMSISDHVGHQAHGHAIDLMENTDFDVEEVIQDVKSYLHDPDLPLDIYSFAH